MSGLAAVLAGRETPGVHRWASGLDVVDVRHAVEHADWSFAHVDGIGLEARRDVLAAIGGALHLPDHFGRNLDALHDCLRDRSGPTVLLWDAWSGFARADTRSFELTVAVLGERPAGEVALEVLLRGEGPAVAVPLLE
ncbi:barstar family protein [Nocardioides caeni]|uniref:Barstar (barnase inhibitor) domain-containing protein n=1 Tax=Nocardioides caeni TaxID=574700 RepID=A0A4S8NNN8_9ACTN|nr:barstar family protein [Nocardioides caeni]THV18530.1 hypothetical protein E9934_02645 [Nocardioides caeni]